MKFTKMQGIGNDYVYVNGFTEHIADPSSLAIRLSDRHFGIGSDGLILIGPSQILLPPPTAGWKCTIRTVPAEVCAETVSAA